MISFLFVVLWCACHQSHFYYYIAHSSTNAFVVAYPSHFSTRSDGIVPLIAPRHDPRNNPRPAESPPVIMFNFKKDRSLFFHILLGILMSVIIYYISFLFNSLGNNGKVPIIWSIFLPILFISIFAIIGLIRVNEK